jgi:hypothetical protein
MYGYHARGETSWQALEMNCCARVSDVRSARPSRHFLPDSKLLPRLPGPRLKRFTSVRAIGRRSRFALCVGSILALSLFSAQIKFHDLNDHLRAPSAVNGIVLHTPVDDLDVTGAEQVARIDVCPWQLFAIDPEPKVSLTASPRPILLIPHARLPIRPQSNPSRSINQDPLI